MMNVDEEQVLVYDGPWHPESQYLQTLGFLTACGERVPNRTGVDTLRTLGVMHRYDFKYGFPLFTTKRVWMKGVTHELLWFLSGSTNIKYLVDNGVNIWNDDAYRHYLKQHSTGLVGPTSPFSKEEFIENVKTQKGTTLGQLGPVYGKQWRNYNGDQEDGDQVIELIHNLRTNPSSRRHILNAWHPIEVNYCALPPCHVMSQYTIVKGKLWCHMYQRSCDVFLGVPFNVASYSLLTYMLAQVCGLEPGGFIHTMHDCHIYENHIDAAKEQLTREPKPFPTLLLNPDVDNIDNFCYHDITLLNYDPHPTIKAELNT
jgi:thymidylate synthase